MALCKGMKGKSEKKIGVKISSLEGSLPCRCLYYSLPLAIFDANLYIGNRLLLVRDRKRLGTKLVCKTAWYRKMAWYIIIRKR